MIYINIDRKKEQSITNQIYTAIKEDILCGKITGGEKMPSTREFSESLQVARNVIINCYEQLIAEGFLYTLKGAGTYVTKGLLLESEKLLTIQKSTMDVIPDRNYRFSFRTGIPDLSCIPLKKWAQLYHKIALDLDHRELDYQDARGNYELRNQLSAYLNRARGTISDPDHILITNGAAQSFNLLCQLVKDTQYALAENPMSYGLRHTLEVNNVKIIPLRTDEFGMITNELPMNPPKLIFTTPSHQFPTGGILPITRRIELINYAKKNNAYIVEDDYDSEFRFDGKPVQAMQYLCPDRVLYVGTFSKTFMPALRIGYMLIPDLLIKSMKEAKYISDICSTSLEQLTLAEFIKNGGFELHIHKMQKLYHKKRDCLINSLKKEFGEVVTVKGAQAGLHLYACYKDIVFTDALIKKISEAGIEISTASKYNVLKNEDIDVNNALIFGYGNIPIDQIEPGISLLAKTIQANI